MVEEVGNKEDTGAQSSADKKKGINLTLEDIKSFAMSHKVETLATLLVFIGLVSLLFSHLIGGGIIGLVAGIFLEEDFKTSTLKMMDVFKGQDRFKTLLFGALMLCVFVSAPTLILGGLAGVGVRNILSRK